MKYTPTPGLTLVPWYRYPFQSIIRDLKKKEKRGGKCGDHKRSEPCAYCAVKKCREVAEKVTTEELKTLIADRDAKLKKQYGSHALATRLRQCRGCGKIYSAREMRSHKCPSGMAYPLRMGMVYDAKQKKYVRP